MSAAMDPDLSKFIDMVQAKEIAHSPWERRLADECDRLEFNLGGAEAAAKRLGAKWRAAVAVLKEIDAAWPVATSELREQARKVIAEADWQTSK